MHLVKPGPSGGPLDWNYASKLMRSLISTQVRAMTPPLPESLLSKEFLSEMGRLLSLSPPYMLMGWGVRSCADPVQASKML